VRAATRRIDAIGISKLRLDGAHAIERIGGRADVETLVGFRWQCLGRAHEARNSTRSAGLQTAADPGAPARLRARGAAAAGRDPPVVGQLPGGARRGSGASGCRAGCAWRTAAVLLAPARTVLRSLPAAAARAGPGARFPGESLGGWRSTGENRNQSRRTRDPRLFHAHRRACTARLLPPACERGGVLGDHARWANRADI